MSYFERRGSKASVASSDGDSQDSKEQSGLDAAKSFFKRLKKDKTEDNVAEKDSKDATAKVLGFLRNLKDEKKTDRNLNDPVKLTLKASSARDSPITATGAPSEGGVFKWYKVKDDQNLTQIEEVTTAYYYPSVDDVGVRLCCQWIPDDGRDPSSFAEVGPLTADLNVSERAQNLYATGNATFSVDVPNASEEQQVITLRDDRILVRPKSSPESQGISVRVRAEFKVIILPSDPRRFKLQNHKGKVFLEGFSGSSEARDTLALVLRRMANFDAQFRQKKTSDSLKPSSDSTGGSNQSENSSTQIGGGVSGNNVTRLTPGQLSRKLEQLRMQSFQDKQTIATIGNHRDALVTENQRLKELKRLQKEELDNWVEQNADRANACENLEEENTKLQERVKDLEETENKIVKELDEFRTKYKAKEEDLLKLMSDNEDIQSKLNTKANVLDGMVSEQQSASQDVESLKKTLKEANRHIAELTDENIQIKSSMEKLKSQNVERISDVDDLKTKVDHHQQETHSMKTKLSDTKTRNEKNEIIIKDLKKVIRQSTEKESALEEQVSDLEASLCEFEKMKKMNNELRHVNSDLRQKLKITGQHLHKEQNNSSKHEIQSQTLAQKYETLQTKHKSQSQRLESAYTTLKHSVPKAKYEQLEVELMEKESQYDVVKTELFELKGQQEDAEREKNKLLDKSQNSEKEQHDKLKQFASEKDELQAERNFFKSKADSLTADIRKLMTAHQNRPRRNSQTLAQQEEEQRKFQEELLNLESQRNDALKAVDVYRRAFDQQLSQLHYESKRASIATAAISDRKSAIKNQNRQMHDLANTLSDALADKEEELRRQREVCRLLGERVCELEKLLCTEENTNHDDIRMEEKTP